MTTEDKDAQINDAAEEDWEPTIWCPACGSHLRREQFQEGHECVHRWGIYAR